MELEHPLVPVEHLLPRLPRLLRLPRALRRVLTRLNNATTISKAGLAAAMLTPFAERI